MEWVDSFGGEAWDVFVSDGIAYVALGFGGLYIFDVSDSANPTFLGRLDIPGEANGVWVAGSHAYVADHWTGLLVIDVADPSKPALLATYDTGHITRDVQVLGNLAYRAAGAWRPGVGRFGLHSRRGRRPADR